MPTGLCDDAQRRLIAQRPVGTVFDVGANIGSTVADYRRWFPSARIHAFEPLEDCFAILTARFDTDRGVSAHRLALSDQVGETTFHSHEWRTFSSMYAPAPEMQTLHPHVPSASVSITVPTTTADAFCREHEIDEIDLLKLDVQGGELSALQGAARMLDERRIRLVVAEVSFIRLYDDQPLIEDVFAYAREHGYVPHQLYNLNVTSSGGLNQADVILLPA
jgi:FkbM family methyltransferase